MYFGAVSGKPSQPSISTGLTEHPIHARLGDADAAISVLLLPDGRFEIEIQDSAFDRVGYVIPPKDGKRGVKVLKGRLNRDAAA